MSKKNFKSQASSSRVSSHPSTSFGSPSSSAGGGFGSASSVLSYLAEQPDLANLTDSKVVVQFKNLSKRDSTTKAKALEELQSFVISLKESQGELEEPFLNAWVKVYPRISIDGSRRVRQLSHALHGMICLNSGKRVAKYMPDVIGAWFAGSHDSDRVVIRAAKEAFDTVFSTAEKQAALPKAYQASILEFCINAILKESVESLSDERTTNAEDAEAKFFRVISSNILTLCDLLEHLPEVEIHKQSALYRQILSAEKFWDYQASRDQAVRRSVFRLLRCCLKYQKELVAQHVERIVSSLLSKPVVRRQKGTALDYSTALVEFANCYPDFWMNPPIRDHAISKVSDFIRYGSQGAPETYWKEIGKIFASLPDDILPRELGPAIEILNALKIGLSRKEEPRSNVEYAWECYISVCDRVTPFLRADDQEQLISTLMLPILEQYINPDAERSDWTITGLRPVNTIVKVMCSKVIVERAGSYLSAIVGKLRENIRTIAPEQSKEFDSFQNSISTRGTKWFGLQKHIHDAGASDNLNEIIRLESFEILTASIETLIAQNGKPYGIANIVEAAIATSRSWVFQDESTSHLIDDFIFSELPQLVFSRSRTQLVSILYGSNQTARFVDAWNRTLQAILTCEDSSENLSLLQELLAYSKIPSAFEESRRSLHLQEVLRSQIDRAIEGVSDWTFLTQLAAAPATPFSSETTDYMLAQIAESLTIENKALRSLTGLELIVRNGQERLVQSLQHQKESSLRQNILLLTESDDETVVERAVELNTLIEKAIYNEAGAEPSVRSTLSVIIKGLNEADQKSLSAETLVELAQRYIEISTEAKREVVREVLPVFQHWYDALEPMLLCPVPQSLALSTTLGGALFLADRTLPESYNGFNVQYDRDGYSIPLRIAVYIVNLFEEISLFDSLTGTEQAEIFSLLLLTMQLMDENTSVAASASLWSTYDLSIEEEILGYTSKAGLLFKMWLKRSEGGNTGIEDDSAGSFVDLARSMLLQRVKGQSPLALRNARAYCYIVTEAIEMHGWKSSSESSIQARFQELRKSDNTLLFMTFVCAYQTPLSNTQVYARLCNELVANITGMKLGASSIECLRELTLLSLMLEGQEQLIESVASQRIVFFVKHVLPWLLSEQTNDTMKAAVCKLLAMFLPAIKEVYGTHWSDTLKYLVEAWKRAKPAHDNIGSYARLPLEYASLRLMAVLKDLSLSEASNDDLKDAWQESSKSLLNGMINLLELLNVTSDAFNQPLRTVNELLSRQIAAMPAEQTRDPGNLYSLIAVESLPVQRTAFEILHKHVPKMQEQISVDAALEHSNVRLPEELLSLIIDSPVPESLVEESFARGMPPSVRGFLSSWLLIFDHYKSASDKVRNDYTMHLKEGNYLATLLDFMVDVLGHSRGRPVDVSRFDITVYSFDIEESAQRDLQWLLAHLYFLCLKYTPAITKAWWIDCKFRQTVISVESWTAKFISSHLIADALATVNEWAAEQDASSSESVTVKTNPRTKEIMISKEIDDQIMSMAIRLPDNFPLGQAVLHGVNRVAVDEKRWNSWLLNSQGVITFSNNSLIDGIIAFRRNVVGALKGQTECAICYSIVGADKQLPTKKCGTCNNLFHGSCLYRWFKSSNSSSCPLCRNPFNYV